ncbi:MAG: peptide deformylase [Pseudomonadota bacterium]
MALLDILVVPDPRLRKTARPVSEVDGAVRQLTDDMLETMYDAPGIGLAATQVNVHKRVVVIDLSEDKSDAMVLINPEIIARDGEAQMQEGCLSIPGIFEDVSRSAQVTVSALDRSGTRFECTADGLLAACIQHEIDHLDGKLFLDYLSPLKRNRIVKKMEKQQRGGR